MNLKTITSPLLLALVITLNTACKDKNDDGGNANGLTSCCDTAPLQAEFDLAKVYIPNAFTPNGDGINDIFFVYGSSNLEKVNSFSIFDGTTMIFEKNDFLPNDPQLGWAGILSSGNKAEDGVYTYKVSLTSTSNETAEYEGAVCLRGSSPIPCVDSESDCAYSIQHNGEGAFDAFLPSEESCN